MEKNEKTIEVLNDLIRINNDRIEGYKKASSNTEIAEADLKTLFHRMAEESRDYVEELSAQVVDLGGQPASDTTTSGKIYRTWMDVKATFSGNDAVSMLRACEFGEDAAQRAYSDAMDSGSEVDPTVLGLIARQKALLKGSHDLVKTYRDQFTEIEK
ncbi:ferritin-like domain-containing protein [Chryseolinea lacunae]|uniref:PA2169 family four-helix-bundle protein n=1 Tax=Chryseolinea lacunae TaxID=2801331 RepID=A0ABS1KY44_9BACT|nr:PA2169 family four-helix-bundle protein [Chryseolinea lacunae]MBL0744360.1 PA2169 family four-helix-bundle protein [Chryseolinea lacunae]